MRDRLIKILENVKFKPFCQFNIMENLNTIIDVLLANGVIVPPCKVGEKVYFVFEGDVLSDEITLIEVTKSAIYLSTCSERYMLINGYLYSEMLDEKAYFTKEEAEQALKARDK